VSVSGGCVIYYKGGGSKGVEKKGGRSTREKGVQYSTNYLNNNGGRGKIYCGILLRTFAREKGTKGKK